MTNGVTSEFGGGGWGEEAGESDYSVYFTIRDYIFLTYS